MASNTLNLNLYKKDPTIDGNDTFNIKTMLNDNWDKIDTEVAKKANQLDFNSHSRDSISHITAAERTTWNGKAEKTYVDDQIALVTSTGIPKLVTYTYDLYATTDNQIKFEIPYENYNSNTDTLIVELSGIDVPETFYTKTNPVVNPDKTITKGYITLAEGRPKDSYLKMRILKNVPIGPDGAISGRVMAIDSIPQDRIQGLVDLNNNFASHRADYMLQVPYAGVTTGTANTYAIVTPTITTLKAGMAVSLKFNVDSTGVSTLNWCGLGAKGIKKSNGTDVTNLKATGIYTLRYDGTNFILQGEGGSGNATASDLLSGKTASTDAGDIVGTMINNTNAGIAITPGTTDQAITQGYVDGALGSIKVKGDANLVASNIKKGLSVFGVVGTYIGGVVTGTVTSVNSNQSITFATNNGNILGSCVSEYVTVSGLSFKPDYILIREEYTGDPNTVYGTTTYSSLFHFMSGSSKGHEQYTSILVEGGGKSTNRLVIGEPGVTTAAYVNSTGFLLPVGNVNTFKWLAVKFSQ